MSTQPTPDPETGAITVGHITVTPKPHGHLDAECGKCGIGMTTGPRFGPFTGEDMVVAFAKTHQHKPKARKGRRV